MSWGRDNDNASLSYIKSYDWRKAPEARGWGLKMAAIGFAAGFFFSVWAGCTDVVDDLPEQRSTIQGCTPSTSAPDKP